MNDFDSLKPPALFSAEVAERGRICFERGLVGEIVRKGKRRYTAEVSGSSPYLTWLKFDNVGNLAEGGCDCPSRYACKHMAALWYAVQADGAENATLSDLAFLLEKKKAVSLRELLLDLAQDSEIHDRLMQMLEPKDKRNPYRTQVRRIFAHYRGDYHYHAVLRLADELQDWLSDVSDLGGAALADALPPLMQELMAVIEYSDDSEGVLSDTMCWAIDLIGQVLIHQDASEAQLAQLRKCLDACLADSRYTDYGDYLKLLYPIRAHEWERLREFDVWQAWLDAKIAEYRKDKYWLQEFFIEEKYKMLLAAGQTEAAHKYLMEHLRLAAFRKQVVEEAIAAEQWPQAEKLLKEGIRIAQRKGQSGTVWAWEKLLLDIYRHTGQPQRELLGKMALRDKFSREYYRLWKDTFSAEEWPSEREKLIKRLRNQDWILAPVLLEEQMFDRLLALLQRKISYDELKEYSHYFPESYAVALLDCYFSILADSMQRPGLDRKNYQVLAKRLKNLQKKFPNQRGKIAQFIEGLKAQYSEKPRRPALLEELEKIKL